MEYQPRQISPSDLQPDVVNGVNIPFSAPGVFEPNYTSADALKAAIINYFLNIFKHYDKKGTSIQSIRLSSSVYFMIDTP